MKTILLASVASLAIAGAAHAADLAPIEAPPTWDGFYIGSYVGWAWFDADLTAGGFDTDDAIAGSVAGYNWQSGNWVFGLEADIGFSIARADGNSSDLDGNERAGVDWIGTARGRVGYAFDNVLVYVAGGASGAEVEIDDNSEIDSDVLLGWTVGAGVEAKINDKASVRIEYLFSDYGSEDFDADGSPTTVDLQSHQVRAVLNYKFDSLPFFGEAYEAPAGSAWEGLYAGGHSGYAFGHFEEDGFGDTDDVQGSLRGVQIGYNWQSGSWVYGLETDFALSQAEANDDDDDIDADLDLERVGLDYVGTVRARVGWEAGRFLLFGTGGFAYGGLELYDDGDSERTSQVGWAAGAGVEYKLTENSSLKVDYLFTDLGDETVDVDGDVRDIDFDTHLVRVGANYRF
jgi:outer membrane immunogenic protein